MSRQAGLAQPATGGAAQCASPLRDLSNKLRLVQYTKPASCELLVVCAGSPRSGSTAECRIAQNIAMRVLGHAKQAGLRDSAEVAYYGYWNFHLHLLCPSFPCTPKSPDGPALNLAAW